MANLEQHTADGTVHASPAFVHSVVLTAGADAATVVVKDGGTSGTARLTLKAAANTTAVWSANSRAGAQFHTDVYVDVTGTSPTVSVEFD